jgi:hypothetical protein
MKTASIVLLLCLASASQAAVYRWQDASGKTQYGDSPPDGVAAEEVELAPLSTYAPPPPTAEPAAEPATEAETGAEAGPVQRYRRLAITQPTDGQTLRSDDGAIRVAVDLRPALQEAAGHRLIAVIDGRRVPGSDGSVSIVVDRGSHRLQVAVIDSDGKVLASSRQIGFEVRPKTILPIPRELGGQPLPGT